MQKRRSRTSGTGNSNRFQVSGTLVTSITIRIATRLKLMVTKLDRLARNVTEGIELIRELFARDIKVHVLNIGLLENTSMGNFFITTLLAVAELERSMIIERTQSGKEVARTKAGFREGRPPLPENKLLYAMELLKTHSYKEVIDITGISKATLCRAKQKYSGLRP